MRPARENVQLFRISRKISPVGNRIFHGAFLCARTPGVDSKCEEAASYKERKQPREHEESFRFGLCAQRRIFEHQSGGFSRRSRSRTHRPDFHRAPRYRRRASPASRLRTRRSVAKTSRAADWKSFCLRVGTPSRLGAEGTFTKRIGGRDRASVGLWRPGFSGSSDCDEASSAQSRRGGVARCSAPPRRTLADFDISAGIQGCPAGRLS